MRGLNGTQCVIVALALCAAMVTATADSLDAPRPWPPGIVEQFRSLPVQDGGRVKPLDTIARFTLLQLSGRTTLRTADGLRMDAMEWMLDCLFHPDRAARHAVFLIESPEVMDALEIPHTSLRGRFSYLDIAPVRPALVRLAQQAAHLEQKQRSRVQVQLLHLAHNVHSYDQLTSFLDMARQSIPIGDSDRLQTLFDGKAELRFSEALARIPQVADVLGELRTATAGSPELGARDEVEQVAAFLRRVEQRGAASNALALLPPPHGAAEWLTPGELMTELLQPRVDRQILAGLVGHLEDMERHKHDMERLAGHVAAFHAGAVQLTAARGEYARIPMEVRYYRLGLLDWGLLLYLLAFVLAAVAWLVPRSSLLWGLAVSMAWFPLLLHATAIVLRCLIRGRPPVTTLYETLLFASAVAVLCALVMEMINRRRVAMGVAGFLGALGLFLARRFEAMEGVDTMPSLIAVLDTNFWLSIHVVTMVMGYAGTLLAAAIAHVYLFSRTFGRSSRPSDFHKALARMTYGAICFSLLFNTLGTVLGGLWAADSWGRFWGWDPKENGALMIVLWQLMTLHARMGGYIRDFGVQLSAVFGGVVVAFAWFGVNLLGVGLHSYGFTSGIHGALTTFYTIEMAVLLVGAVGWLRLYGPIRVRLRAPEAAPTGAGRIGINSGANIDSETPPAR